MDPRSSAQDVHRCDLCETAIVHSYCNFCHVNLCKPCVVDHISDEYDKHKIVRFQDRRSTLIYPKCVMHPHKYCKYQCKNCDNSFICSSCTASEQHKGHIFVEVSHAYKTQKGIVKKDTEELENSISPKYKEIALDLKNQLASLDGGYEKLTTVISKQGKQWHREIDIVINKMKTELSEIKVKHKEILQKHLDEIKQTQSLIDKALLAMKEIKESTEVSPTIEYSSKIKEFSNLPLKITVRMPTFIPKSIDREKLYSLFGQITPLSTATEENTQSANQPKPLARELMREPVLITEIKTGYNFSRSLACGSEDKIWLSGLSNEIKCFNINGSLHQTNTTKSGNRPRGIAVDVNENILYSDDTSNTVNILNNGQTEELIRLQGWVPTELCVTSTGDLLVSMYSDDKTQSKVVRYLGSTEKQTIQFDGEGKPLYLGTDYSKYITENRNHDICVADSGASAVVVVNQDGKLRWRYTGHPSVTKNKLFEPWGITADSQSRILTADTDNHCVHILDQNGKFLRYINTCNLRYPYGLCVDNNDNLFVSESRNANVKKIKYLQ
uniref:Tripartite motif-containing protein 3 n=1 Tax=Magallana gigas TaxID=29159 RepID=K1R3P8_MAGGI|eukprot:XP_019921032.1 PREDICTED: uncharacterized protein LOC109618198 [Crassostrea gigas]